MLAGRTGSVDQSGQLVRFFQLANKGFVGPIDMAVIYMKGNEQDKAMDLIEKAYEIRDPNMPYIATHMFLWEPLFDNPRFIEILQKMHLPLPEE